jgi:hypothetical protein
MNFVNVSVALSAEGDAESIVAVDDDGDVWEYVRAIEPRANQRPLNSKAEPERGWSASHACYAGQTEGWRRLSTRMSSVLYHEKDPRHGLPLQP